MKKTKVNVLLTGVGGRLSVLTWRALKQSIYDVNIIACDSNYLSVGLYRTNCAFVVPRSNTDEYIPRIIEIINKEKAQIVMTGGVEEMLVLARHSEQIKKETGAFVVAPPLHALDVARDKWNLVKFLAENGFDHPKSTIPENREQTNKFLIEISFPYIVKSRFGAGSVDLVVVHNKKELDFAIKNIEKPIIQEYLYPDNEEYTVGCFCDIKMNPIGSIVMKRSLGHGCTYKGEVVINKKISSYCEDISRSLNYIGPCNLQLRLTKRGPVLFEINPRLSSTESARAYYNYNMPEMCIKNFVFGEDVAVPEIKSGYFFRVTDDVFVDRSDIENMSKTGFSKNITGEILEDF